MVLFEEMWVLQWWVGRGGIRIGGIDLCVGMWEGKVDPTTLETFNKNNSPSM
jgi:hypothetical protein